MNSGIVLGDISCHVSLDRSLLQVHWPHTNWKDYFHNFLCSLQGPPEKKKQNCLKQLFSVVFLQILQIKQRNKRCFSVYFKSSKMSSICSHWLLSYSIHVSQFSTKSHQLLKTSAFYVQDRNKFLSRLMKAPN